MEGCKIVSGRKYSYVCVDIDGVLFVHLGSSDKSVLGDTFDSVKTYIKENPSFFYVFDSKELSLKKFIKNVYKSDTYQE